MRLVAASHHHRCGNHLVFVKKAFDKYPANNFHSCEHEDPANNNAMVQL